MKYKCIAEDENPTAQETLVRNSHKHPGRLLRISNSSSFVDKMLSNDSESSLTPLFSWYFRRVKNVPKRFQVKQMFLGTSGAFLNNSMQSSREKATNSLLRGPVNNGEEMHGVRGKNEWNFRGIHSSSRQTWLESASDSERLLQLNFCVFASCDDGGLPAFAGEK